MTGPTFVLRTVRNGQVTIYGRQFAPDGTAATTHGGRAS